MKTVLYREPGYKARSKTAELDTAAARASGVRFHPFRRLIANLSNMDTKKRDWRIIMVPLPFSISCVAA